MGAFDYFESTHFLLVAFCFKKIDNSEFIAINEK